VEPDSYYKISCYIKTENVVKKDESKGANINIESRIETSRQIFNTSDGWEYAELYVQTGKDINEITIALALGGYYGDAMGSASFDNVSMVKMDIPYGSNLPEGVSLCKIGENDEAQQQVQTPHFTDSRYIMYLVFMAIIFFLVSRAIFYNRKKLVSVLKAFKSKRYNNPKSEN
jgi:hypothetical protein